MPGIHISWQSSQEENWMAGVKPGHLGENSRTTKPALPMANAYAVRARRNAAN